MRNDPGGRALQAMQNRRLNARLRTGGGDFGSPYRRAEAALGLGRGEAGGGRETR